MNFFNHLFVTNQSGTNFNPGKKASRALSLTLLHEINAVH